MFIKRNVVFNKNSPTFQKSVTNSESMKKKITDQILDEIFQSVKNNSSKDSSEISNQSNQSKKENNHNYVEFDKKNEKNHKNEKNENNSPTTKNLEMLKSNAQFTKFVDTKKIVINALDTFFGITEIVETEKQTCNQSRLDYKKLNRRNFVKSTIFKHDVHTSKI